jgi:uncharacterized protein (TIGR02246 family)
VAGMTVGGLALATALCAAWLNLTGAGRQVQDAGAAASGASIRQVWRTLDETWNARDAERFSRLFTPAGSFRFIDRGEVLAGAAAVRQSFAARFPTFDPAIRHQTRVQDVRLVSPVVGTVDGTVEILRLAPGGPQADVVSRFAIFAVMTHTPEGWRIHELRAYELPADKAFGDEPGEQDIHDGR